VRRLTAKFPVEDKTQYMPKPKESRRFAGLTLHWTVAACLFGCALLHAQDALNAKQESDRSPSASTSTVSVDVKVVNVLATVRDKHGKLLPNLSKDDFALEEDGRLVNIQYFSRDTDLPLTVGLLVDTSLSQRTVLEQEKNASKTFLDQMIREKDAAFVLHFDREVELLQDLTSSKEKLAEALEQLQTQAMRRRNEPAGSGDSGDPDDTGPNERRGMRRGGTTLYDAIYLASDELMQKQKGRKAVVVLSDGVDRGSKEGLEGAIEAAQKADTIVYSIFFKGEEEFHERRGGFGYPGRGGMDGPMGGPTRGGGGRYPQEEHVDGKKILERISKETGGRMFEVSKKESVADIYGSIEEELRNQYNLGFTPDKARSSGYHKLALRTKQKDAAVQARDGYYLSR
jgi:VWFA-related protein